MLGEDPLGISWFSGSAFGVCGSIPPGLERYFHPVYSRTRFVRPAAAPGVTDPTALPGPPYLGPGYMERECWSRAGVTVRDRSQATHISIHPTTYVQSTCILQLQALQPTHTFSAYHVHYKTTEILKNENTFRQQISRHSPHVLRSWVDYICASA